MRCYPFGHHRPDNFSGKVFPDSVLIVDVNVVAVLQTIVRVHDVPV
jgi:hypothetical protein